MMTRLREFLSNVSATARIVRTDVWLRVFVCFAALICVYRFSLITQGALAFSDELRYHYSFIALNRIFAGDMAGFFQAVHSATARPGYVLVQLFPAWIQYLLAVRAGMAPDNPVSLMVPLAGNAASSLTALFLFFAVARRLFPGNSRASVAAALVYGIAANSTVYIRHILGCDQAMVFFMAGLYILLRWPARIWSYACAGACAVFTYHVYPGFFYALPFFAAVAARESGIIRSFAQAGRAAGERRAAVNRFLVFGAAAVITLLFFIVTAKMGSLDYFAIAQQVLNDSRGHEGSDTEFREGFSFLPVYLAQVETFGGMTLLVMIAWYLAVRIRHAIASGWPAVFSERAHFVILAGIAGHFIHCFRTFFLRDAAWVGRLLHLFFPFFVLAAVAGIEGMRRGTARAACYAGLLVASFASFALFARGYALLSYPADVLYRHRINTNLITGLNAPKFGPWGGSFNTDTFICEQYPYMKYYSPGAFDIRTNRPYTARDDYALVNFCFFSPNPAQSDIVPYSIPEGSTQIFEGRHFLAHPAYLYEGFVARTRETFLRRDYKIRIYEVRA